MRPNTVSALGTVYFPLQKPKVPIHMVNPAAHPDLWVDSSGNVHKGTPPPTSGCPGGYIDAAGNCTTDWHNPYSLYLPDPNAPASAAPYQPAPTPLPCASGQYDASGNCLPGWLEQASALFPTFTNLEVTGGALGLGVVLYFLMRGKHR